MNTRLLGKVYIVIQSCKKLQRRLVLFSWAFCAILSSFFCYYRELFVLFCRAILPSFLCYFYELFVLFPLAFCVILSRFLCYFLELFVPFSWAFCAILLSSLCYLFTQAFWCYISKLFVLFSRALQIFGHTGNQIMVAMAATASNDSWSIWFIWSVCHVRLLKNGCSVFWKGPRK